MKRVHVSNDYVFWHCPGCNETHAINTKPNELGRPSKPVWTFNGSVEHPTFSPSVLCHGMIRCHCFVREGKIEFLADCDHALAGQTVDIPDFEV